MSGPRETAEYLRDMIDACERIVTGTTGMSDEKILDPEESIRGNVLHQFMVLGEAAKHIPPGIQRQDPVIPWTGMAGMRDRIVHYYFGIEDRTVIITARNDVPELLPRLRRLLTDYESDNGDDASR